jgi:hypothetical protein
LAIIKQKNTYYSAGTNILVSGTPKVSFSPLRSLHLRLRLWINLYVNPYAFISPQSYQILLILVIPHHLLLFKLLFIVFLSPLPIKKLDLLWQQAMDEKLYALHKIDTWDLIPLPPGKSDVGCRWVYKIKTNSDGSIERYKVRLVAKWYSQQYDMDYEETFTPIAKIITIHTLIAVASVHQWYIYLNLMLKILYWMEILKKKFIWRSS